MEDKGYPSISTGDKLYFEFESVSSDKRIRKAIEYVKISEYPSIYSLSMGDIQEDGNIDLYVVSNNNDTQKVFFTIFQTMLVLFDEYPDSKILFYGSTPNRTRLYQIQINKFLHEVEHFFQIWGIVDGIQERFVKNKNYQAFIIGLE
jgi:hypothetical protein